MAVADTVGRSSRVVGSVDFVRPVVNEDEVSDVLHVLEGVRCAMPFSVKYHLLSSTTKDAVEKSISEALDIVEENFSTHVPGSEINKINNCIPNAWHSMSKDMQKVVHAMFEMHKVTRGVFDGAVAPILNHYETLAAAHFTAQINNR